MLAAGKCLEILAHNYLGTLVQRVFVGDHTVLLAGRRNHSQFQQDGYWLLSGDQLHREKSDDALPLFCKFFATIKIMTVNSHSTWVKSRVIKRHGIASTIRCGFRKLIKLQMSIIKIMTVHSEASPILYNLSRKWNPPYRDNPSFSVMFCFSCQMIQEWGEVSIWKCSLGIGEIEIPCVGSVQQQGPWATTK